MALGSNEIGLLFRLKADDSQAAGVVAKFRQTQAAQIQAMEREIAGASANRASQQIANEKAWLQTRTTLQHQAANDFLNLLEQEKSASTGLFSEIATQGAALAGPLAAVAALSVGIETAMIGLAKGAADAGDRLYELHIKTGFSVETLSALDAGAKLAGTDVEAVTSSLVIFDKKLQAAREGKGADLFKVLHTDLADSEAVLSAVFNRLNSITDPAQRSAEAVRYFGRSGAEMLKVVNESKGNIDDFKQSLADMGLLITGQEAEAAHKFEEDWRRVGAQFAATGRIIGEEVIPTLQTKLEELSTFIKDNRVEIELFAKAVGMLSELAVPPALEAWLKYYEYQKQFSQGISDRAFAPDVGFALKPPKGETAPTMPAAPTEAERQFKDLNDSLNQYVDQYIATYGATHNKIVEQAKSLVESLQSDLNRLGDSSKLGAVTDRIEKLHAAIDEIKDDDERKAALEMLIKLTTQAQSLAKAYDTAAKAQEEQKKQQQEIKKHTEAYTQSLVTLEDAVQTFGNKSHEVTEQLKIQRGMYGALTDEQKDHILSLARIQDAQSSLAPVQEAINKALAGTQTYLGQVLHLLDDPKVATFLTPWEQELLRLNAIAADFKKNLEDAAKIGAPSVALPGVAAAASAAGPVVQGAEGVEFGPKPPDPAPWMEWANIVSGTLGHVNAHATEAQKVIGGMLGHVFQGVMQNVTAWILYGKSGPQAARQFAAGIIAAFVQLAAVKVVENIAYGFEELAKAAASAASFDPHGAALHTASAHGHFLAAVKWGAGGIAAAVAGRAVAGDSASQGAGGSTASSSSTGSSTNTLSRQQQERIFQVQRPEPIRIIIHPPDGWLGHELEKDVRRAGKSREVIVSIGNGES